MNIVLLIIISVPKPPKVDFTRVPKEIVVKKGEKIEINIPFVGTPRPDAEWARDGKPLSDIDTDIETKDKNSKLCIPHSERTDAGLYELTLSNEVGTEKVPINVIVKGIDTVLLTAVQTNNEYGKCLKILYTKASDKMIYANSAYPDRSSLIRVFTVCHSTVSSKDA